MNDQFTPSGEGITGHYDTLEQLCKGIHDTACHFMLEAQEGLESGRFDLIEECDVQNLDAAIQCLAEVYDKLTPGANYCPACMQDTRPRES